MAWLMAEITSSVLQHSGITVADGVMEYFTLVNRIVNGAYTKR